jgi:hypothetical protein
MERRHLAGGPPPSRWLVDRGAGKMPAFHTKAEMAAAGEPAIHSRESS